MKLFPLLSATAILTIAARAPTSLENSADGSTVELTKIPAIDIGDYKSWKQVTKEPHLTNGRLMMSCIAVTTPNDPHSPNPTLTVPASDRGTEVVFKSELGDQELSRYAYIHIFVNKLGEDALLKQAKPKFPAGSIIVKERHSSRESKVADYVTVMRKLPAGSKPETSDWQYLVFAQDAKTKLKKHNLPDCVSCHNKWKDTDYTSREYLTPEQLAVLK